MGRHPGRLGLLEQLFEPLRPRRDRAGAAAQGRIVEPQIGRAHEDQCFFFIHRSVGIHDVLHHVPEHRAGSQGLDEGEIAFIARAAELGQT